MKENSQLLSIVVPCFNEEEVIATTHEKLSAVLNDFEMDYEIIYVDDGSKDRTYEILKDIHSNDDHVVLVKFSRNFGHQVAITAGADHVRGDAVVFIDSDLQDPPEVIPRMVEQWTKGYSVVYGQRKRREGETFFKLITAKYFYRTINSLAEIDIPLDTGDFRLLDRKALDALKQLPERDRFVRGLVTWLGFNQTPLEYERHERFAGTTKYPLKKMLKFAADGIFSFSLVPLKLATTAGFLASGLSLVGIIYALTLRLFTNIWVSGWTTLLIAVLFLGGIQLICLGIIGEYVGRAYFESKRRPLYLIDAVHHRSNKYRKVNAHEEVV